MHIYLFTKLVMHGLTGTHPPGTEAQDPLPQLKPGWGGSGSGHCWGALGRGAELVFKPTSQVLCSCPAGASVYCVVEGCTHVFLESVSVG